MNKPNLAFAAVFLTGASILMLELALTRIYSEKLWYHYAFMAVSVALFGISFSGVFTYVFRRFFHPESIGSRLSLFCLLFAISILVCCFLTVRMEINVYRPFAEIWYRLLAIYVLSAIPFFFGGVCLALALTRWAREAGKIYFFDLAGSSLGCILTVPVLSILGGPTSVILVAAVASCGSFFFSLSFDQRRRAIVAALATVTCLTLVMINDKLGLITVTHLKHFNNLDVGRQPELLYDRWNSFSRVSAFRYPAGLGHFNWSLSPTYELRDKPNQIYLVIDGEACTMVTEFDGDLAKFEYLEYELTNVAHRLRSPTRRTLVIGAGGGVDVLSAVVFGDQKVVGVELNPLVVDAVRNEFGEFSGGLYDREDVEIVTADGRTFVSRSNETFDLIQMSLIDTWAATAAGAYSLSENNLYTREAFVAFLNRLEPDGIFTVSRFMDYETLKLATLFRAAAGELGIDSPALHVAVLAGSGVANFMIKRTPFTAEEIESLSGIARDLSFQVLYLPPSPGLSGGARASMERNPIHAVLTSEDPNTVIEWFEDNEGVNLTAPTDDNPFFFNMSSLGNLKSVFRTGTDVTRMAFSRIGMLVLMTLFAFVIVLSLVTIVIPLLVSSKVLQRRIERFEAVWLFYFACLGLGFMLIEIPLIQRFILFLGHPIFAASVILFSVLLFGSIGSYVSGRIGIARLPKVLPVLILCLIAISLAYGSFLTPLFHRLLSLDIFYRIGVSMLIMLPLGFLLGMPFPSGVRLLGQSTTDLIPWVWGINGSLSVLGTVLAVILAMANGFSFALGVGAAVYLIAFLLTLPGAFRPAT